MTQNQDEQGKPTAVHAHSGFFAGLGAQIGAAAELFASMRFAISLLAVICIASVVGTVLKQNEPYANYVNQLGPFWAEVFSKLQLFNVYSAWWFLLILAFLVLSTSLCIARNAPKIFADLRTFKENIRLQAFRAFSLRAEGELAVSTQAAAQHTQAVLQAHGWKVKTQDRTELVDGVEQTGVLLAAKKGAFNKLGYLAAHSAIVLVCLGGLMDGDLMVRTWAWVQGKTPYQGGGLIADVSKEHWLTTSTPAFRGNVFVAEGAQSNVAILNQSDGVLLQPLPFSIGLKKFSIEFYSTGMPKLFASDIVLHDQDTGEQVEARIEVNHPFHYRGVSIYQSSFDDGGSKLVLKAIPIRGGVQDFEVNATVGSSVPLSNGEDRYNLELTGLRVFNIEDFSAGADIGASTDAQDGSREAVLGVQQQFAKQLGAAGAKDSDKHLRNVGPSVSYKLRDAAGQAIEYNNYMQPVDMRDGSLPVFLLGLRTSPSESFRYLRIPVDDEYEMDGFFRLREALYDTELVQAALEGIKQSTPGTEQQRESIAETSLRTLEVFTGQGGAGGAEKSMGLQAIGDFLEERVPVSEREKVGEIMLRVLNSTLFDLNNLARAKEGLPELLPEQEALSFISQSILGISDLAVYNAPLAFRLDSFEQVQASVFQVSKAPGQTVVYLGAVLLIVGVFVMLYIRERRLWVWLTPTQTQAPTEASAVRMAMSSNRQTMDTDKEFSDLRAAILERHLP